MRINQRVPRQYPSAARAIESPLLPAILVAGFSWLLLSCQSDVVSRPPLEQAPATCRQNLNDLLAEQAARNRPFSAQGPHDELYHTELYYSLEKTRGFSQTELQAIQSLDQVSETIRAQTVSGYRSYELPGSKLLQEQLQNGDFRTILPIQNVDGWNLKAPMRAGAAWERGEPRAARPDHPFLRACAALEKWEGPCTARADLPFLRQRGTGAEAYFAVWHQCELAQHW